MPKRTFQPNRRHRAKTHGFPRPHEDQLRRRRPLPPPRQGPPQDRRLAPATATSRQSQRRRSFVSDSFRPETPLCESIVAKSNQGIRLSIGLSEAKDLR